MSSKNTADASSTPLSGVKIKVEPGTSSAPLIKNIKTEPGLSGLTTRLTSFRVPRDLTLGGNIKIEKPKKLYAPNVNVQRNKKKEDGGAAKEESKRGRGRARGRGQGERGRGRGKTPSNLVQSKGVFSEGITDSTRPGRRYTGYRDGGDDSRDTKTFMEKPLLNLNQNIDKAEEEEKLKTLLRDDFIDDGMDSVQENAPLILPLMDEGKLYKNEIKHDTEVEETPEEDIDVKPIILSNGEAIMPSKPMKPKLPSIQKKEKKPESTISQMIENQMNGYLLIQFPDCLPGLRTSDEPTDPRLKRQSDQNPPSASDNVAKSEYCTLGSLKGGMLGKMQICKSGKARLIIGDNSMIVDMGSRLSFRQDLVAAKIDADNSNGQLINLGRVSNTLICSPDWETMLADFYSIEKCSKFSMKLAFARTPLLQQPSLF